MAENLNPVETTVNIDGKNILFVALSLNQSFNNHHNFEITVDYEALELNWMNDAAKLMDFIGKDVIITMKHKEKPIENIFKGTISNISMTGYHGQKKMSCLLKRNRQPNYQ